MRYLKRLLDKLPQKVRKSRLLNGRIVSIEDNPPKEGYKVAKAVMPEDNYDDQLFI